MKARLSNHLVFGVLVVCAAAVLLPTLAHAQAQIVGQVRDESGGVLPGVTVEAASPAIIEKVRTAVTDDQGRYRIEALRPGTYKLTFSLTGFSTVAARRHRRAVGGRRHDQRRHESRRARRNHHRLRAKRRRSTCSRRRARRSSRATSSTRCRSRATSCRSACCRPASGRARPTSAARA